MAWCTRAEGPTGRTFRARRRSCWIATGSCGGSRSAGTSRSGPTRATSCAPYVGSSSARARAMAQNIYDNEEFFEGYSRLPRSVEGLDGAPEWPALRALLPDLRGLDVLDLGCGFGWFCRWARGQGAAHVLGIDVSERMLARSRATTLDTAISYTRADMEHLELSAASFNLVYSSLALHYVEDLNR